MDSVMELSKKEFYEFYNSYDCAVESSGYFWVWLPILVLGFIPYKMIIS
jgi:hypothetical protein